jgi:type I restriction enzyme S subunit
MISRRPVLLGKVAKPVSVRASTDCTDPVFSVTKHAGMVPSSEYFKKQVFSRDIEGYKFVQRGQFAYATIHLDEGSIGLLDTVDRAVVSPMYTVFETDSAQVYGPYLLRLLKSEWALSRYQTMGNGSVHRRRAIPFETLEKLEIALPDLYEQKRIAAILDKADSLRHKRQQAISLADDFLRAIFLDMFGDPTTNPKGWSVFPMGEVIEFKGGSQPPKETFSDEARPGYVRLVQIRDFKTNKYKTYIPEKLAKRAFEEDDVMIARYGPPVFQILRGLSGSYNVALMKAQPKASILKEIIFWLLQLPAYHDVVVANSERTAGQSGVNLELLNKLLVPLPPLSVQQEIAVKTERISKVIEQQKYMLTELEIKSVALQAKFFS